MIVFSEPIREDYGDTRGFDQFEVFEGLMVEYDQAAHSEIVVKPHPREDAPLGNTSSKDAHSCLRRRRGSPDGMRRVIGMTSMVLIEAHLLGYRYCRFNLTHRECQPVGGGCYFTRVAWSAFPDAWQLYITGNRQTFSTRFNGLLRDADSGS